MKTAIRAILAVVAMIATTLAAAPVRAVPAGIMFTAANPTDGSTLFVARTAADNPLDPPTFQLKSTIRIDNTTGGDHEVEEITVAYPGSTITPVQRDPKIRWTDIGDPNDPDDDETIVTEFLKPGRNIIFINDGLERDLPTPPPPQVEISFSIAGDSEPLTVTFDLALWDNDVPLGAFFFPMKQSDLDPGQYWEWGTRHVVDSGGGENGQPNPTNGSQRYALDVGVVRWTGTSWTGRKPNTDGTENSHSLSWNKSLYGMADGTIIGCYKGEEDHDPGALGDAEFDNLFGNTLTIQHGNDVVKLAHMRHGYPTDDLCPGPEDTALEDLSIPVSAGQFLGRIGNTGRSGGPHLHWQVESTGFGGTPMQFLNLRALGDDTSINNLGGSPQLQPLHGMTLHKHSLISPNPCGLDDLPPAGFTEVAKHGIAAECYQDVFNQIVSRGYRPVFVDGYDVGGQTFFNAVFRPSGPNWVARHGLTGGQYQQLFDDLTADGFRLLNVDSYLDGGQVRYAAIFDTRPGPGFAAFHGLDDDDYADRLDELAADGLVPVNVSTVEVNGSLFWTGLFEDVSVTGWTVQSVPVADYQDTFDANVDAGRVPIYVNGFNTGSGPFITGIWIDPIGGSTAAVHGLSGAGYQTAWEANTGADRWTRAVTGYDDGGSARFAAVWRSRPDTTITSTPVDPTNQTTATFEFTASNPFTTFQCKLGLGILSFTACSSPHQLTGLGEGTHTFQVRAIDRDGLRDLSPDAFSWVVDLTPPEVDITEPGENTKTVHGTPVDDPVETTTIIGWGDITATATDALSGVASVAFTIDGVPVPANDVIHDPGTDTWTFTFEPDKKGENVYEIVVTATDEAGNSASDSLEITATKTGKKQP